MGQVGVRFPLAAFGWLLTSRVAESNVHLTSEEGASYGYFTYHSHHPRLHRLPQWLGQKTPQNKSLRWPRSRYQMRVQAFPTLAPADADIGFTLTAPKGGVWRAWPHYPRHHPTQRLHVAGIPTPATDGTVARLQELGAEIVAVRKAPSLQSRQHCL